MGEREWQIERAWTAGLRVAYVCIGRSAALAGLDTAGTDMDRGERQEEGRGTQVPMEKYIFKH